MGFKGDYMTDQKLNEALMGFLSKVPQDKIMTRQQLVDQITLFVLTTYNITKK